MIPYAENRFGGQNSYGEWCHTIGVFQGIIYKNLFTPTDNHILDIGCGTGKFYMSVQPYIGAGGRYIGVDVGEEEIKFCKSQYPQDHTEFALLHQHNNYYSPHEQEKAYPYPVENSSIDCVLALSVWTHLLKEDAIFCIKEVARTMKDNGIAIFTIFHLDQIYERNKSKIEGSRWLFDRKLPQGDHWYYPIWANLPEDQIGIDDDGLALLLEEGDLRLIDIYPGSWKKHEGLFLQDIVVCKKK